MKSLLFDDNVALEEIYEAKEEIINPESTVLFKQSFESRIPTFDTRCESRLLEEAITESYDEKTYGIPSLKKYPMPDEKHVKSAIRFFNYVDEKHEKELADNINKKIKEFKMKDINVGPKNRFVKYCESCKKKAVNESGMQYHETIDKIIGLMPNGIYEQFDSIDEYKNNYNKAMIESSLIDDSELIFEGKIDKLEKNGKIIKKPTSCPKCGSKKIGIYIDGEPICKCSECGTYLGTVPFKEATEVLEESIELLEEATKIQINILDSKTVKSALEQAANIKDEKKKSKSLTDVMINITSKLCHKVKGYFANTKAYNKSEVYDGYIKELFPKYMKSLEPVDLDRLGKKVTLYGFTHKEGDDGYIDSLDDIIKRELKKPNIDEYNIYRFKFANNVKEDLNYIRSLAEFLYEKSQLGKAHMESAYQIMTEMVGIDHYDVFNSNSVKSELDKIASIDIEKERSKQLASTMSSMVGKICAKLKYILGQVDLYDKDLKYDGYIMSLFPKYLDMMTAKDIYRLIESIREHAFTTGVGHKSLADVIKANQSSSRDSSAFIYNETLKVRRDLSSFLYLCEDKYKKERFDGVDVKEAFIGTLNTTEKTNKEPNPNDVIDVEYKEVERKPGDPVIYLTKDQQDKAKKAGATALGTAAVIGGAYAAKKIYDKHQEKKNIEKENLQEAASSKIINTDDNGYFITDIKFRDEARVSIAARYLEDAQKNIPFIIKCLSNIEKSYSGIMSTIRTELYQKYCKNHGSLDADKFNREFDKMKIQNNIIVYRDNYGCIFEFNYPVNQFIDGNILTIVFKSDNEGIIRKFGYTTENNSRI